ncbi:MAG: fumarylacetoacetate hydrolase, partial [Burkholderiales bacterium]|nr:fumarylacetoacetate hydrolase [Burkholderiales bacterium]
MQLTAEFVLPDDAARALLLGRAWIPGPLAGPSPIVVRDGVAYDVSHVAATAADILALDDVAGRIRTALAHAKPVATLPELLANSVEPDRDGAKPWLLAPCDLQAIRACGVTFVASMLERVIEEHANGDPAQAEAIRRSLGDAIGASLSSVKPGSAEAMRVKALLQEQGLWSQYL